MSEPSATKSFAQRCQKRNYTTSGTWMARRIARPAALYVTRIVAPLGLSANGATLIAWTSAVAAALAFAWGAPSAWFVAAVLFQNWYLWDHVDGQLARLRGTVSLEGAQLDFLMHHTVNLLIPLGVGYGCFIASEQSIWLGAGTAWALAMLLIPLRHDTAYRAMFCRLQHLEGTLTARGLGDERPAPEGIRSGGLVRRLARVPRKVNEIHVVMNLLTVLAVLSFAVGDATLLTGRVYLAAMAPVGAAVAAWSIARDLVLRETEREWERHFHPPEGHVVRFRDGMWRVEPVDPEKERAA